MTGDAQNFTYRFVQLKDDEGPSLDVLEGGESYFLVDPKSLDQLISALKEARLGLRGMVTSGDMLDYYNPSADDLEDKKLLTIREAYDRHNGI